MKTFLFYDVETSGLNPAFDQILTFACIRTDLQLNEIDRQSITVRLREDIVPSPGAFLTHGLTFEELAQGITEYEAAKKIHALVNVPGTISLGYNSLSFDDEFLRFLFYRNLFDPYIHQYGNGCSRMDILPVAAVFKVFAPQYLKWPEKDGKSSLKLDLIAEENKFITSGRAHEAMSDVEALIALSRIFSGQKDIWEYCLNFFNKTREDVRIGSFEKDVLIGGQSFASALMLSASFGPQANYLAPVLHVGFSKPYKNQSLWLRLDSEDILGIEADLPMEETFIIRKRSADNLIVLPPLDRFQGRLPDEVRQSASANLERVCENTDRFLNYAEYHQNFKYPYVPDMDADAALYQDGFFSRGEKKDIQMVHDLISAGHFSFTDKVESPRIKALAARIAARNFNHLADDEKKNENSQLLRDLLPETEDRMIIGYRNDAKLSCRKALDELSELEPEEQYQAENQKNMILCLRDYIKGLQVKAASFF